MLSNWLQYFQDELAAGLLVTLQVLAIGSLTTYLWALVVVAFRVSKFRLLRFVGSAYIEFFRGTPLIVQILIVFAYLPNVGIVFPPFESAVIVLTLNAGSFLAEFYRSGLQSVPKIELEAAQSLGMNKAQVLWRVTIPHAVRVSLPALGTLPAMMLLGTPFVYLVGLQDMMAKATLIHDRKGDFSVYLEVTVIYVLVGLIFTVGTLWLERKVKLP